MVALASLCLTHYETQKTGFLIDSHHVILSCAMLFSELSSSSSSGSMRRSSSRGSLKGLLSPSKLHAHHVIAFLSLHFVLHCPGDLGPVVQSIVSLTMLLRRHLVKCNADYVIKYAVIFCWKNVRFAHFSKEK